MRLTPHAQPLVAQSLRPNFAKMVKCAFTQPRKTLANNLKKTLDVTQIEALGIDPTTRPQNLSIDNLVKLAECL
jgi:16S rRNA (adenine1518-N6/adenine1519-N6)-dimethyltransferase